jgi:glycogen operon protein
VTAHDGKTLADLVTYERARNEANGEHDPGGHADDLAWNAGVEGPTDEAAVRDRRWALSASMLATLLLSTGVPMLLAGDERGRTQQGNSNAYCQDNAISWVD